MSPASMPASLPDRNVSTGRGQYEVAFDTKSLLVLLVLAAGVALTTWGAWHYRDTLEIGWQPEGRTAIGWALLIAAGWMAVASLLRLPVKMMLVLLPLLVAGSAVGVRPVATVLLIIASATQLGLLLLPAREERSPQLTGIVAAALGLAVFALLLQATGRIPLHYPAVYLGLLALPFLAMPKRVRSGWAGVWQELRALPQARPDPWNLALWTIAVAGVFIRLLGAFAPEVGTDALAMHLQIPTMVARDHVWSPGTSGFIWAWMPMSVDWIYTLSVMLGGEPAARLINFLADAMIVVGCAGVAREIVGDRAGAVAAVLYSAMPLTYLVTTSLFVENIWTLWVVSGIAVIASLRASPAGYREHLVLGFLFGAALSAKVITVFWAPIVLFFAWKQFRTLPHFGATRVFGVSVGIAMVFGGWPYLAAWWETGNPVFPFLNDIFRSPLYPAEAFDSPFEQPVNFRTLFDLTFVTDRYLEAPPGAFGWVWLTLLPAGLLAIVLRSGRWAVAIAICSLIFVAVTFALTSYLRYIAPVFPVWAVLVAAGFAHSRGQLLQHTVALVSSALGLAGLMFFANSTWWYRALPPMGPIDPEAYRKWESAVRPESRIVDQVNVLGLKHILWLGTGYYAGLQARVTTNSWHQASGWADIQDAAALADWVAEKKFDGLVIAADFDACSSTWLCEFVGGLGEPDVAFGAAKLFVGRLDRLRTVKAAPSYDTEKLQDTDLLGQQAGWDGNGTWDKAAGVMRVSSDRTFSQAVAVEGRRRYLYSIRARCVTGPVQYRQQVNWVGKSGEIIEPIIIVSTCTAEWGERSMSLTAPAGSVLAFVYAGGHALNEFVDIDSVSFRE